jgi:predicted nucleic acid-binding protein
VSTSFYCDTSALVKLYHREAGTERMEEIFRQEDKTLIISELAIVEFYSTLAHKMRTGEITLEAQAEAHRNFETDCQRRFVIAPLSSSVIQKAKELLQKHGNIKALRTLDALHLGACLSTLPRETLVFVSADTRQIDVGLLEGLQVLNPESPLKPQT